MVTVDSPDSLPQAVNDSSASQECNSTELNQQSGPPQSSSEMVEILDVDDDDASSGEVILTPPELDDAPTVGPSSPQPEASEPSVETESSNEPETKESIEKKLPESGNSDTQESTDRDEAKGENQDENADDESKGENMNDNSEDADNGNKNDNKEEKEEEEKDSNESEAQDENATDENKDEDEKEKNEDDEGNDNQDESKDEKDEKDEEAEKAEKEAAATKELESWTSIIIEDEDPESLTDDSPSRLEWLRMKREENEENEHLDKIMSMVGHEKIKEHFLAMKVRMDMTKSWKVDLEEPRSDLILLGNDGTGKRRIAQIYAEFLYSIGVIARRSFEKNSGYSLDDNGSDATVTFFDNADKIDRETEVPAILEIIGKRKDPTVLIFSFRKLSDDSRKALYATSECCNRLPDPIVLGDYNQDEIFQLLRQMAKKRPEFEDVPDEKRDVIIRFLARRVCRGTKSKRSANIHILKRELDRLAVQWRKRILRELTEWSKNYVSTEGRQVDDEQELEARKQELEARKQELETRKKELGGVKLEDAIGPNPSDMRKDSKAWKEIQSMIGLESVKKEIEHLFNLVQFNRRRELQGKPGLPISLNRCFLGEPGVGKTTVARLFGTIIKELGLLSKGDVITKTPNDLIGEYIGESEKYTRAALEKAEGGVLIIDDAHMLYRGSGHGRNHSDQYRQGIIDTLVANIHPGEDRCVILCGYPQQMEEMILNGNPGLQRRFPMENAFRFSSYNDDELCQILDLKMTSDEVIASEHALKVAREVLSRNRTRPCFGNGGDVENLLNRARLRQVQRLRASNENYLLGMEEHPLQPEDFDPDFDRASHADKHRDDAFRGFVGFEEIVTQFQGYQQMVDGMRQFDIDPRPHIPWAFIFKGPPGTGKTSTARKVGKLFYDMGFLSSEDVITCSVTDLVGEYCGQTGPKVISQFEKGLGKVLFIDEAYRLHGGSSFNNDAIGEIVDIMTKPRYVGNMVVILAGYGEDMEKLLASNHGLRSRFPTHVTFPHMAPSHCFQHLIQTLAKLRITFSDEGLEETGTDKGKIINEAFRQLILTKGWASGRDVETIAKNIIGSVFKKAATRRNSDKASLSVSFSELIQFLLEMLRERSIKGAGGYEPPALRELARKASLIT